MPWFCNFGQLHSHDYGTLLEPSYDLNGQVAAALVIEKVQILEVDELLFTD